MVKDGRVAIFMADGLEECEALIVVDILRRADIEVDTVCIADTGKVVSAHNICIACDKDISEINFDDYDMLVLPGGIPGTPNLRASKPLCDAIQDFAKENKYIAAICAAPSIFADLGLLAGKQATAYPSFKDKLIQGQAEYKDDGCVVDGNIITARGMGCAIDFAYAIVATFKGQDYIKNLKEQIIDLR